MKAAETANYIMSAGSDGTGDDQVSNTCGLAMSHAYAILAAFEMTSGSTTYQMLMLRNPWGTTGYSGTWKNSDRAWTDALVAQVPYSIDPRTSHNQGIFVMDIQRFRKQ